MLKVMSRKKENMNVENERRKARKIYSIIGIIGIIGLFLAASLLGLPWYYAAVGSVVWVFGLLIVEAEAEDAILVKAYGPSKKEEFVSERDGE